MTLKFIGKFEKETNVFFRAVVVAQLVEQSLPIPEVCCSYPVTDKNFIMNIYQLSAVLKRRK